jgi:hypothetical protein
MRLVHPPKVVTVHRDGRWHDGQLRAWRRDDDAWRANVLYSVGPRERFLEWLPAERVWGSVMTP